MKRLNSYYVEAEKIGGQSYLEGCLACATAYIVFLCMETRYEKVTKQRLNTPTAHNPTGKPANLLGYQRVFQFLSIKA